MIGYGLVYGLLGLLFLAVALLELGRGSDRDRGVKAAFYALLALSFLAGDRLGDLANGVLLLALAGLAASGRLRRRPAPPAPPATASAPLLLAIALTTPAVTLLGSALAPRLSLFGRPLVGSAAATPAFLAFGVLAALAVAALALRPRPTARETAGEAGRLLDAVGWALILPQALAALGAVFALAGVGGAIGGLAAAALPLGDRLGAVIAYTVGMALLTALMGNAFAAFPVMAGAIGVPILVRRFGGDPAVVGAVGMLSGFCGTLVTPMAANFNLVPVALLELRGRYAVIRAQAPTAVMLLAANTLIMAVCAFGGRHG